MEGRETNAATPGKDGWTWAFAPGSVSNLNCGFDLLGFAVQEWGDRVGVRACRRPGVRLLEIRGDGGRLPMDPAANTAGVAAAELLRLRGRSEEGLELRLLKGLPLASGLGSSGASGVAAALATNRALGLKASPGELLAAALAGERVACGAAHPDNVTPSLLGGLLLIRGGEPPVITELPVPPGLLCALVHPHAEVSTGAAREALPEKLPLAVLTAQAGHLAAFVAALFREDDDLLRSSLIDLVAEPARAALTPGFAAMRRAAAKAGALGSGLSGSGPTLFALVRGEERAAAAATAMATALERETGLKSDVLVSAVGAAGARILSDREHP